MISQSSSPVLVNFFHSIPMRLLALQPVQTTLINCSLAASRLFIQALVQTSWNVLGIKTCMLRSILSNLWLEIWQCWIFYTSRKACPARSTILQLLVICDWILTMLRLCRWKSVCRMTWTSSQSFLSRKVGWWFSVAPSFTERSHPSTIIHPQLLTMADVYIRNPMWKALSCFRVPW
jgi:hypothetical protein